MVVVLAVVVRAHAMRMAAFQSLVTIFAGTTTTMMMMLIMRVDVVDVVAVPQSRPMRFVSWRGRHDSMMFWLLRRVDDDVVDHDPPMVECAGS